MTRLVVQQRTARGQGARTSIDLGPVRSSLRSGSLATKRVH